MLITPNVTYCYALFLDFNKEGAPINSPSYFAIIANVPAGCSAEQSSERLIGELGVSVHVLMMTTYDDL